jgi:conflict system STAND superfamily ATPase
LVVEPQLSLEDELLMLTNLDAGDAILQLRDEPFLQGRRLVLIGAGGIAASLDRHPELRVALPSVLGLRDLDQLIDADVRGRSSFDVERAQALARVFWPTRAYERARAVLGRHRFVVLTGPPEMGKTAIAQMLALAYLTRGWEAHECNDPDDVWRVFDRDRAQVFVADDAFGSTEYRPDAAERWARGLGRLLAMLDEQHWLIWTSRPAPLKAGLRRVQRERGSERFPAPGEVLVDASDLDLVEKTLILFRHAKARGASGKARALLRSTALSIVEHPHFTPERIRRFVGGRLDQLPQLAGDGEARLLWMVERELASPTDAMRTSFRALEREHRDLLIALLDAPAGLIDERELTATVRRHHAGGLSRPPGELIDRLTDHFLRITPLGIGWVHPSWRDLVIDELRRDAAARRQFLSRSGVDGVALALSQQGGVSGERTLPLLKTDSDWDQLGDRLHMLLSELEDQELARVLFALSGAVAEITDPAQRVEARSLAIYVLDTARRAWDQGHRALSAFLLEAWYALSQRIPERLDSPRLTATWAELHPGSLLIERPDRSELVRAEEWLAVARVLSKYDPGPLRALGFFDRDRDLLKRLIVILTSTTAANEELRPLAESVLTRIEELVPELATGAHSAIEIARLVEDLERKRWWVPEDITVPPSTERVTAVAAEFTPEDVDRVLSDL